MRDPLYISAVVALVVFLKSLILLRWQRFKAEKSLEPMPTVLRKGVYVAWGPVEKVRHYGKWIVRFWLAYMAVLIALAILNA